MSRRFTETRHWETTAAWAVLSAAAMCALIAIFLMEAEPARAQTTSTGTTRSFITQTATGATVAFDPAMVTQDHGSQIVVTGGPAGCTYDLEGSNDGGTTWFDITASPVTCTSTVESFVTGKPVDMVRGDLVTLSGGTTPTVTLHYAGR